MQETKVKLDTLDKIKRFVEKVSKIPADIDLVTDRYIVDAKSILGVSSLDTTKPITCRVHDDGKLISVLLDELEEFRGD